MKAYFREKDILKHVSQSDDCKASVAERHIQTVKRRLYRYLSHNATTRWVDVLPKIVYALNHTKCRVTGMRPADMTADNWQPVWRRVYGEARTPTKRDKRYQPGTAVRIDVAKRAFTKGYLPNFTQEVFRVKRVRDGNPTSYALEDQKGEDLLGVFYSPNFSKARLTTRRIAQVWQTRKRQRRTEHLVSWVDGNPREREWITEAQLI